MESLGEILGSGEYGPSKYLKHEFQDFGYRMATELGDLEHRSLYMRLAKREPRARLESALDFAKGVWHLQGEKSRAKLFMWKLKELRATAAAKQVGAS